MAGRSGAGNARQHHAPSCTKKAVCTCGGRGKHGSACPRSKRCSCGARWQARITAPDGTVINAPSTFATKIDADAWLMAERRRMEDIEGYRPPLVREALACEAAERAARNRPPTFVYAERWLRERKVKGRPLAPETVRKHRIQLRLRLLPVFGDLRLDEITPQLVTAVSAHGPLVGSVSPFAIRGAGSGTTPRRHTFATAEEVARLVELVPPEMRVVPSR